MRRDAVGIHGLSKVEYEIRDGEIVWGDTGPVRRGDRTAARAL